MFLLIPFLQEVYKVAVAAYLLLGLVFLTLAATVFYDIPQLNIGNVLHQQKDLTIATSKANSTGTNEEQGSETKSERSRLKDSFKRVLGGGKYTVNGSGTGDSAE